MAKPTDHVGTSNERSITDRQLILLCLRNAPAGTDKKQVARVIQKLSEGWALEALDRLYEQNHEGLKRLAQEGNQ